MNQIVGDFYKIVEGDQIGPHKWDFGFNTWTSPVYYVVFSKHPDGPEGYRHSAWDNNKPMRQDFVESLEDAQRIVQLWTPERRRRYLTQDPLYWTVDEWCNMRGWMTPNGRRKYRTTYNKYKTPHDRRTGRLVAVLSLTDKDFRHGITLDLLYQLRLYNLFGDLYEVCRQQGYDFLEETLLARLDAGKALLSAPGVPEPLRSHYLELEARCLRYAAGETRLPEKIET